MKEKVLKALYHQLVFHSENGKSEIEHPWFAISEAAKSSGTLRTEVTEAFYAFEAQGLIQTNVDEKQTCRLTPHGLDRAIVERVFQLLATTTD